MLSSKLDVVQHSAYMYVSFKYNEERPLNSGVSTKSSKQWHPPNNHIGLTVSDPAPSKPKFGREARWRPTTIRLQNAAGPAGRCILPPKKNPHGRNASESIYSSFFNSPTLEIGTDLETGGNWWKLNVRGFLVRTSPTHGLQMSSPCSRATQGLLWRETTAIRVYPGFSIRVLASILNSKTWKLWKLWKLLETVETER